jgi:hypothetical protein
MIVCHQLGTMSALGPLRYIPSQICQKQLARQVIRLLQVNGLIVPVSLASSPTPCARPVFDRWSRALSPSRVLRRFSSPPRPRNRAQGHFISTLRQHAGRHVPSRGRAVRALKVFGERFVIEHQ